MLVQEIVYSPTELWPSLPLVQLPYALQSRVTRDFNKQLQMQNSFHLCLQLYSTGASEQEEEMTTFKLSTSFIRHNIFQSQPIFTYLVKLEGAGGQAFLEEFHNWIYK